MSVIIIIHSIYSLMRFPYKSMQTVLTITRKILPCLFRGKTSRVYRKNALPKATLR